MSSARLSPHTIDTSKSQSKKRKNIERNISDSEPDAEVEVAKEKSKKKRKSAHEESVDVQQTAEGHQKKKKSKKHDAVPSAESAGQEETQISTADFLSAIVAAATATSSSSDPSSSSQWAGPSTSAAPSAMGLSPAHLLNAATTATGQSGAFSGDTSSESVLRALQDLDISKITNVLRALGEAQNAAAINPQDPLASFASLTPHTPVNVALITQLMHQEPPPLGQKPVSAGRILGKRAADRPERPSDQAIENYNNLEDAHLLATKWLSAGKLAELAKTRGLVYKKGKFSAIEEQQLNNAIEHYAVAKQLTHDQLTAVIFPSDERSKDNSFWSEITAAVPQRPIIAVYHHVRRTHHPLKNQGRWLPAEDDKLRQAVATLGQQWEKVSLLVGRRAPDCRDRYRNHIAGREHRVSGAWAPEEEEELSRIVQEMTVKQGGSLDDEVFWGTVSDLMGNKRSRQQCRIKWTDSLSKRVKLDGKHPRWSNQDAYILIHKLDSLRVRDDSEIDWKTLTDSDWNLWSPHVLQRRFLTMKKSVKGYEEMSHQEIMEILKAKKTNFDPLPPTVRPRRKVRKYTSAETVES